MPYSEIALKSVFEKKYCSSYNKLKESCGGPSPFTLGDVRDRCKALDNDADPSTAARLLWGCGGGLKNVCELLKASASEQVALALTKWVDRLSPAQRHGADQVLCLMGRDKEDPQQPPLVIYLLLGSVTMNPKVQTFVFCTVAGQEHTDFVHTGVAELPCDLSIATSPSRLCQGFRRPRETLSHATSDEVALRLASHERRAWVAQPVQQTICDDRPSLMIMRMTGLREDEEFSLTTPAGAARCKPPRRSPLPPAVLAARGLQLGDPEAQGQAVHILQTLSAYLSRASVFEDLGDTPHQTSMPHISNKGPHIR